MDAFFSPMARTLNRNLLKYSAGRAIFCPRCDQVADARRWVVVTQGDHTASTCATCWDAVLKGRPIPATVDVVDGRVVFARAPRKGVT